MASKRAELLDAAVRDWPDSVAMYDAPMAFAFPRWNGSFQMMDGIARRATEQTRPRLGAAMYAMVYERAFRGDGEYTLADSQVDWNLMKQGFIDLESRQLGERWIWGNFASLACQMRDRQEAKRLFEVSDRVNPGAKVGNDSPCRTFALAHPV